jgi:hypothetical protein
MHTPSKAGSVILFALAVVAVASMLAYSFALSMRSASTVAKDLVVAGLAESAARMGARHAAEVVLADYLADPSGITRPYGPHLTHFMDTKHFNRHWAPNPDSPLTDFFYPHPGNDSIDDIPHEARMWYLSQGTQDQGFGLYAWYDLAPFGLQITSALITGTARYIEPGRYNTNGGIVRFSDAAATPNRDTPVWYNADFQPVATRAEARYRVRYAVIVIDLGGHLLWGRQQAFETAATEWDHALAQAHNPAFVNLVSFIGANRSTSQSIFLGWGSTLANPDPANRTADGYFLPGFDGSGTPTAFETIPGIISTAVTMSGKISATGLGGPPSWTMAERLMSSDRSSLGHWCFTPFGRASNYKAPAQPLSTYYDARVSTPWRVNALTAPAETVRFMLRAYMPPQTAMNIRTGRKEKGWTGWTNPAWPGLPQPTWNGAETTITDIGPTAAPGPGVQVQSSLAANLPEFSGGNPFAAFASPNHSNSPSVDRYIQAYPDVKVYWEDYAFFETTADGSPGSLSDRRNNHPERSKRMLGWFVDIDNSPSNVGAVPAPSTAHYEIPALGGARGSIHDGYGEHVGTGGIRHYKGWFNGRYNRWGGGVQPDLIEPTRGFFGKFFPQRRSGSVLQVVNEPRIEYTLQASGNEPPYWHRDSYWMDLFAAAANAVIVAKAQHLDRSSCGPDYNTFLRTEPAVPPSADKAIEDVTAADLAGVPALDLNLLPCLPVVAGRGPNHVRELDRLFLAMLGEYMGDEVTLSGVPISPSGVPKLGIMIDRLGLAAADQTIIANLVGASPATMPSGEDRDLGGRNRLHWMQASANIRSIYTILTTAAPAGIGVDPVIARRKVANMELVLNDWRMSFYGANPTYTDFTPLDFDGDGYACASCYTATISIPGFGGDPAKNFPARGVATGIKGPTPDVWFSLTGYFVFEKGRYWRTLVRGEVFDEVLRKPVHEVNLETAFVVDPEGRAMTTPGSTPDTTTLYSRWITNYYRGMLPMTQ